MRDSCRIAAVAFPMLKKGRFGARRGTWQLLLFAGSVLPTLHVIKWSRERLLASKIALFFYLETSLQSAGSPVGCPESETQPLECIKMSL